MIQLDSSPTAECGYSPELWCSVAADRPAMPPSADTDQRAGMSQEAKVIAPSGNSTPQSTSWVMSR